MCYYLRWCEIPTDRTSRFHAQKENGFLVSVSDASTVCSVDAAVAEQNIIKDTQNRGGVDSCDYG